MAIRDDLIKLGSTNPELRPHIRPLLRVLANPDKNASNKPSVDLLDNPMGGRTSWPNVTWHGMDVFDKFMAIAQKAQRKLVSFYESANDSQEVYLGYDPKRGNFTLGFDVWFNDPSGEESFGNAMFTWDITTGHLGDPVVSQNGGFYDEGYKKVHSKQPQIVDLRLD